MPFDLTMHFLKQKIPISTHPYNTLKILTNPSGTLTLALPTLTNVSLSTPVSGSNSASAHAGHTIPVHCFSSIDAPGTYALTFDRPDSRYDLWAARTEAISGAVRTFSDYWEGSVRERKDIRRKGTYDEFFLVLLGDRTPGGNLFVHERVSQTWEIELIMA
jgi:hypothetical protein